MAALSEGHLRGMFNGGGCHFVHLLGRKGIFCVYIAVSKNQRFRGRSQIGKDDRISDGFKKRKRSSSKDDGNSIARIRFGQGLLP